MRLIDSHAHVLKKMYREDRDLIIKNCQKNNIDVINIGIDIETSLEAIEISKKNNGFYSVVGIHPVDSKKYDISIFKKMEEIIRKNKDSIIGIGESGIDLKHNTSLNHQKIFFDHHIEIARKFNLPLVVHCRESFNEILPFIKNNNDIKFLMHSWTGDSNEIKRFNLENVWFAYNGIVTFNNAKEIAKTLKLIPKDRILIETDCPYLSPVPDRGKINDPTKVRYVAEFIARYLNIDYEIFVELINKNTKELFKI